MPKSRRQKPLYQRGPYRLVARPGRNLDIIWYDERGKRERSVSAGSRDVGAGRAALDRLYLQTHQSENVCPTCGQIRSTTGSQFVTSAIADYLISVEARPSFKAIRARLDHIVTYIGTRASAAVRCTDVDANWIDAFRAWAAAQPIINPHGSQRARSLSTIENSVLQLAAAINHAHARQATPFPAAFRPSPPSEVNRSPHYRADVAMIAAMFSYALKDQQKRASLLAFLRLSVATWGRPDAVHEIDTAQARRQWFPEAQVLALNPEGRRQTRKYRATVPVPRQIAPILNAKAGQLVRVNSVKSAWESMESALGLPRDGQSGMKLIRRSVAHLARKRLGEEHWVQGEIMLGHHKASVSDIYALPDPANLGRALAVTEAIIEEIEAHAPGAFTAGLPQSNPALSCINGGKNG